MTWDEILILLIMVMGLFAIDMLVAKFNLKVGRIVAVLTFFVLFPLGLVAGVVALICMNIKGKQRKISITALFKNVVFRATLFAIILLYLIDMTLLKIFPDAKFPVVFLSFCFSPLFIFLLAKALVYLKEKARKPKKADLVTTSKIGNQEQKNDTAINSPKIPRIAPVTTSYNTPYDDPQCDDNFNSDKYNYELRVAGNGQVYYARIN